MEHISTLAGQKDNSKRALSSILYYISGHGFGHAVRSCQVIRSIQRAQPHIKVYVRSAVPEWLLHDPTLPVFHESRSIDVGMAQKDSLEMEVGETLRACGELHEQVPRLVSEEVAFIQENKIRLVIGDIPPLCFEIAARASVPSVAVSNFTWAWIYRAYAADYPAFTPLIEEMESFYRKATLALALPHSCNLEIFPRREPIPWITRRSALSREEARERFGLPRAAVVVLLSFGGFGLTRLPWEKLTRSRDFFFVATAATTRKGENFLILPEAQRHYENLVRAADVIVSKPGYGIVADAIAHQVPLLYTSRGDFPEYPFLVEALARCTTVEFISQEELLAGNIESSVRRLLDKEKKWPPVPVDGAAVAAEKIIALL